MLPRDSDTVISGAALRTVQRQAWPTWLYLYFILAGSLLFALSASLFLNHCILDTQAESLRFNREWTQRSLRYAELGQLAAKVNLPGNDVFESGDPEAESENLRAALLSFKRASVVAQEDLKANVTEDVNLPFLQGLSDLNDHVEQMAAEAKLVFAYFVRDKKNAGARMAAMDRQYIEVRSACHKLDGYVGAIQKRSFQEQEQKARALALWEYALTGLVVFVSAALIAYAMLLSHKIAAAALVAERNLALLRAREDALRSQSTAAESANHAKSSFLANMSHEIRTPMTAIMGYAELLLEPDHTSTDRRESLQVIHRSARHLLTLINDVLDISKIEADRMTVEKIPTNVAQLAAEVVSLMRPGAVAKGLNFHLTFGDSVARVIASDPVRVKQVLMNLVGNALKFTERGEVRLNVLSKIEGDASITVFEVTDSGIGMSDDQVQRIFQPFTQADESTTRKFGGTGLGLTISKRLAELLGGELTAQSLRGVGSKFRFTIDGGPAENVEVLHGFTEALVAGVLGPAECKPLALQGHILFAEDGPDNQRLISMHLRNAGATVDIAENGRIAVEMALTQPFDLILMDMQMPEMDGYQATRELRSKGYMRPIVALTAHAMADDRGKCLAAGCSDFLTKPIEKKTLLSLLAGYLGGNAMNGAGSLSASMRPPPAEKGLLSAFAEDPDMKHAIKEFVATLPERTRDLHQLVCERRVSDLRRVIHQLKGAGGGYGFDGITQLASEAERTLANEDSFELIETDVNALIKLIQSVEGFQNAREATHGG